MKRLAAGVLIVFTLVMASASLAVPAFATTWTDTHTYYRGNAFLWSRDRVTWSYTGLRIKSASASQGCGYIFPNHITAKGIKVYKPSNTNWYYTCKYHASVGIPTPWGPVDVSGYDSRDYLHIDSIGGWSAHHD
jgi:hypothetical protein